MLIWIAYLGFISLGLPDTLIGVAWPSVRDAFGLKQGAVSLIFIGAGCSYFLSSFLTGRLLKAFDIGTLLAASSALVALSGYGYAAAPVWILFALCSVLHGLGSGAIDAGLNHYVAHNLSARHMNWLHAFYSVGAMLGPLIMTGLIAWNGRWRIGYFAVATLLLTLAVLFTWTRQSWDDLGTNESAEGSVSAEPPASGIGIADAMRHSLVWLQMALFFVYTGLEITVGHWSFTILTEARGFSKEVAGLWVAIYWASILVGRILFGTIADGFGLDRLVRLSIIIALGGTALFAVSHSPALNAVALAMSGLGLATIYPCLMSRTPERLGKGVATHAIGFQVSAAMLGAAALPSLSGFISQGFGLQAIATAAVVMAVGLMFLHEIVLAVSNHSKSGKTAAVERASEDPN